jgi:hypothetical protein
MIYRLSDRCRRSSLVATPKIIHRMIFVCDIMHSTFYIEKNIKKFKNSRFRGEI